MSIRMSDATTRAGVQTSRSQARLQFVQCIGEDAADAIEVAPVDVQRRRELDDAVEAVIRAANEALRHHPVGEPAEQRFVVQARLRLTIAHEFDADEEPFAANLPNVRVLP